MHTEAPYPKYDRDRRTAVVAGRIESLQAEHQRVLFALHEFCEEESEVFEVNLPQVARKLEVEEREVLEAVARGADAGALTSYELEGERLKLLMTPR